MRILIATVTAGGGHLQAAAALEEAWTTQHPSDEVRRIDLLDLVPKLQRKVYAEGYVKLIAHAPELYELFFNKTDNPKRLRELGTFRRRFAEHTNRKFVRLLKQCAPDIVLCTHFLPLEVLGAVKSKTGAHHPFVVCVVTDFEAHALWMEPSVDLYCVAAEETKARLIARQIDHARVAVTGIPIAARFSTPIDTSAVRRRCGLRDDLPTVLVLGGGFGMGPMADILESLDRVEREFQTVVVAGRNQALRRELAAEDRRHPTHVLGFVSNMHEMMAVSDLIITKPGGLTTSEALALGRPLFILNPIPGQETANSDFLLERGAAAKANRVEDLPFRIDRLLGSPKLSEMSASARALGRPGAASAICAAVCEHVLLKAHSTVE
ncbi:MAG TPA: glycosyltransferase [Vicinamibacterales bacterium]|nr:glycosyltransferase [Vicinamibacterales bacterium]